MSHKVVKHIKDYSVPNYLVEHIDLTFVLNDDKTVQVQSITTYVKNPIATPSTTLTLDGQAQLISITMNDNLLSPDQYSLTDTQLSIANVPDLFTLNTVTLLKPWANKTCSGLYTSNNTLITQCEPEGFRTITYYPDHPDILATFTTTIIVKDGQYNTILSNGNKIVDEISGNNKIVKWHDPFKKPSYLFALVIGNLAVMRDHYTSKSGRNITLEIYTETNVISSCSHAMASIKQAMHWDETRFNLEYDLDIYMLVATSDFNMGAMENKGLNIFNTKYILAEQNTATDTDFINVEAVIGHEYFHNWTGNRVTCRDWFQLSLKEGLTVFRDHEFTADLHNRSVRRIQAVKLIRNSQFPEDNGPLAHSVRPESYVDMNNFYTVTVYEKGAEVVRMYQTILGHDGFNKGFKLYIQRHDGNAVTCDDFCQAMADANNIDLTQFMLWYKQAGTPNVNVSSSYNSHKQEYRLIFKQTIPDTPGQINKQPMLIPIKIGLLDKNGVELPDIIPSSGQYIRHDGVLVLLLTENENIFIFKHIKDQPIPSLLRDFSAPIKLTYNYTQQELLFLASHDNNEFNRFESLQLLFQNKIIHLYDKQLKSEASIISDPEFWNMVQQLIRDPNIEPGFKALALQIPTFSEMLTSIKQVNPKILTNARNSLTQQIGEKLFDSWMEIYDLNLSLTKAYNFNDIGKRSLKNIALFYILQALSNKLDNPTSLQIIETMALGQFHNSYNMTDSFAVLSSTANLKTDIRQQILHKYYAKWQDNELVMDKWFAVQAMSDLINVDTLDKLMVDKTFIATNPNKIYALLRTFTQNGLVFHSDAGYSFMADKISIIDKFNPHVASILTHGFNNVVYLDKTYHNMAKRALNRILDQSSDTVREIASKILSGLN